MSVERLITDNIDVWTSTIKNKSASGRGSSKKIELYGIKKLRELILELAVRGKLVPQDPTDEPASVLLERIAEEKALLVKDKKIKKPKALPEITNEEVNFELPKGWVNARLGDFVSIIRGITFPASAKNREPAEGLVACLRTANIQQQIDWNDLLYVDRSYLKRNEQVLATGDIVMSMANSRELVGKVSYTYSIPVDTDATFGGFLSVIRPYQLNSAFLMMFLRSPAVRESLIGSASQTTNIANISLEKLNPLISAIPPLAEQHRIVAKVDELMSLCDQLEQQAETSIEAHQTLVEVLLNTLTSSADAQELTQNWQRISEHFDTLFTTEKSIDTLKQTILQLAVMGKLVPQDPNDEPAAKLLERIAEEKAQLIKDKKIKKQKALPEITEDEKPFDLPSGWEWSRFGDLGYDLGGGTPSKGNSEYWGGPIPWVSPKDMKRDYIDSAIDNVTDKAILETTIKLIPENSLLMVVRGMILAHSFPVALTKKSVVINQDMKALIFNNIEPEFLLVVMKGIKNEMVDLVDRSSHGTCKLVSDKLWNVVLAIPPLRQQRQIVEKASELLNICDQFKARLKESQTTQSHLTDAIIDKAL